MNPSELAANNPQWLDPEVGVETVAKAMETDEHYESSSSESSFGSATNFKRAGMFVGMIALGSTAAAIGFITSPVSRGSKTPLPNDLLEFNGDLNSVKPVPVLDDILPRLYDKSLQRVQDAINPAGSTKGSMQAALSGTCPNYVYTWVRDQALVYQTVLNNYELDSTSSSDRSVYEQNLKDFAAHAALIYTRNKGKSDNEGKPWSLADTKYEMNGDIYREPWCDPQTDGPSLRAQVLIRFANRYLKLNNGDKNNYVRDNLYSTNLADNVKNPIRRDLEYLVNNWNTQGCEPWEEIFGQHFYNKVQSRRALKLGIEFVRSFNANDSLIARMQGQLSAIENEIARHWRGDLGTIIPTLGRSERFDDIQTVLATLHSFPEHDNFYTPIWNEVLANAAYTMRSFENMYNINRLNWNGVPQLGVAIGRYGGDVYNGGCPYPDNICPAPCLGQPWILATNAIAELIYKALEMWQVGGEIEITAVNKPFFDYFGAGKFTSGGLPKSYLKSSASFRHIVTSLLHAADAQLKRTAYHTGSNLQLDEQYNADTGMMMSAGDLTWSYASLITAYEARLRLNPGKIHADFTPSGKVEMEVIVAGIPEFTERVVLVGNKAELGMWNPCNGVTLHYRRSVRGATEWSVVASLPASSDIKYKIVTTSTNCAQNVRWQSGADNELSTSSINPGDANHVLWR